MARASAISLSSYTYSLSSALKVGDEDGMDGLVCSPLRTPRDVKNFIKNPPAWRSLCINLVPHSDYAIRNMDIVKQSKAAKDFEIDLTQPETFCHFDPALEDVPRHRRKSLPKTLVCHDMANGYHDDCKVDGTYNYEAYTFYNWAVVDIFCYFSHHFITIPPLGWINVGHEHGVKVIGTIVTEWAVGAQIWDRILASPKEWQEFASFLVTIAKTLKFDGWLLNIENMVKAPDTLLQFVQHLHSLLHKELPSPVLVWYDSVTATGDLLWQNALNDKNKAFFDACDGIFTNYAWGEDDVASSLAAAGGRARDVFVGIDVWGRNFVGGGQFNTQEAMKIIHRHGLSVAIFAPAWTHEALDEEAAQISTLGRVAELEVLASFRLRERALWGSLWPFLHTKLPCRLPFQTAFCQGQGKKRRLYGEVLGPSAWFNIRHQCYQPSAAHGPHGYLLASAQALSDVRARGVLSAPDERRLRESFRARAPPQPATTDSAKPADSVKFAGSAKPASAKPADPAKPGSAKPADPAKKPADPGRPSDSGAQTDDGRKRSFKDRFRDFRKGFEIFRKKKKDAPIEPVPRASPSATSASPAELAFQVRVARKPDNRQPALVCVATEKECLELYLQDSFNGGSCLAVNPAEEGAGGAGRAALARLFHCDFRLDGALVACVVTKALPEAPDQFLDVVLAVKDEHGPERRVVLDGAPGGRGTAALAPASAQFKALQSYLLLREPGFYVAVDNAFGWNVRYYEVAARGRVTSVNCRAGDGGGPVLLGHFGLCQKTDVTHH